MYAEALTLIDGALAQTGDRPDFLDTKAMVHLARLARDRELKSAVDASSLEAVVRARKRSTT